MESIKELLDAYINSNYTFRCQEKYKGLVGRIRAFWYRIPIEQEEENSSQDRYRKRGYIYGSGPNAADVIRRIGIDHEEFYKQNSFATALRNLIREKGKDNISVYKRARIDRKLFSKIMTDYRYIPGKKTVMALAIGLELSITETQTILNHCGFALSENILFDVIVKFFIERKIYDLDVINQALSDYGQKMLSQ